MHSRRVGLHDGHEARVETWQALESIDKWDGARDLELGDLAVGDAVDGLRGCVEGGGPWADGGPRVGLGWP